MKPFKSRINFRLRTKLTFLIEGLVVAIVLFTGIITTMREKKTLESELRKRGLALAADLAKFTERPLISNDLPTLRRFVNHSMEQDYVRYAIVLDARGKVIMHSNLTEIGKIFSDSLNILAVNSEKPGITQPHLMEKGELHCDIFAPITVSGVRLGTVRLGYSYMAVENEISRARRQILIIGLVTVIIGGLVSYLLATFISSPISRISDALRKVADGNLDFQLKIDRNDEIGELSKAFNNMTSDLRRTTISKDYVDSIIGSMNDTLFVLGPEGKIRGVNRAICELLGYQEAELIGKPFDRIGAEGQEIFKHTGTQMPLEDISVANRELDYVSKSGKRIPMLFSASVMRNQDGKVLGTVGIARDITVRRRAEEALRKSEKELHFLSSQLLTAQEKERRRLSRELHDELGQSLMVLKLKLGSFRRGLRKDQSSLQAQCDAMIHYLNEVTENVRRLSRDLSPSILDDLGLLAAIRWLVENSTKHGNIASSLDMVEVDDLFSQESQITLYRIIQECLTNVVKHAQATHVSLEVKKQENQVIFRLQDDGKGFDPKEVFTRNPGIKGLGLAAMYERIRMLRGSLDIWSQKGKGARITFTVPVDLERKFS